MLMHITGGQPARGEEILSIRYRNTSNGGRRNIFVEDGLMLFVTEYHKGYAASGTSKVIHRYLPREVGELLMYYMWFAMPMQHRFEAQVLSAKRIQPFLWSSQADVDGKKWTSERLKRALVQASEVGMGTTLTISSYRQVAIAMARKYMRGFEFDDGSANEKGEEDELEADEAGCWWSEEDEVIDLQAGHGTHVAGMVYARGIEEASDTVMSMRGKFRRTSQQWQRFLRFASALGSDGECGSTERSGKRKREAAEAGWEEAERRRWMERWGKMRRVNIHDELEKLMGPEAGFGGIQEEAITAIFGGRSRVLAVMGTGAGKSLTFMLPAAWEEAKTTIVVVPMTALRADMKRRCDETKIRCAEWDSRRPPETASIVLVTPESAVTKGFRSFLNRLQGSHRLDRIVIDECHTILDSGEDFRPKVLELRQLMSIGCQMVMLTATLPPQEEDEFFRRMGLHTVRALTFRARTTRGNIQYRVRPWDGKEEVVVQEAQRLAQRYADPEGKTVI